jgi:hypothetical protein
MRTKIDLNDFVFIVYELKYMIWQRAQRGAKNDLCSYCFGHDRACGCE